LWVRLPNSSTFIPIVATPPALAIGTNSSAKLKIKNFRFWQPILRDDHVYSSLFASIRNPFMPFRIHRTPYIVPHFTLTYKAESTISLLKKINVCIGRLLPLRVIQVKAGAACKAPLVNGSAV
jgi:hypothetical protein